jgi:hypothetical protein
MNDLQRAVATLRSAFLKIIFDVAHLVRNVCKARNSLASRLSKRIERRRFHLDP